MVEDMLSFTVELRPEGGLLVIRFLRVLRSSIQPLARLGGSRDPWIPMARLIFTIHVHAH